MQQSLENKVITLEEAVSRYVTDGCSLSFGGIIAREPMAVVYEIVRQRRKNLTYITDSSVEPAEIMIAGGCIRKLEAAYVWVGVVGIGHNYRRAVEKGIPHYLEIEEYSNYGSSLRFLAGAIGAPYMPTQSLLGSDLVTHNPRIKVMEDPYGTGPVALVPAAQPDVAFIHVQRADISGNAQIWGMLGNDENIARAAKEVIVTCEEIVPTLEFRKIPNMTTVPSYCVSGVVEIPFCSHPLPVSGYYWMDVPFRREMAAASKTREGIEAWMDKWIFKIKDHRSRVEKIGAERLKKLRQLEFDNYRIPRIEG